jgi:5'-methylthioadenosine phosphorylase
MPKEAEIGVLGGTGFYSLLEDFIEVDLKTPYGRPSAKVAIGNVGGRKVAFLPRHGVKHQYPPHKIPYLANIYAFKQLGIRRILAASAAGSLQPRVKIGDIVVCDQFINLTHSRRDSFYDGPRTIHISTADPYCPELRSLAFSQAEKLGLPAHKNGTVAVIEGPRFSTRAESRFFSSQRWEVINMTQYPEVVLAREMELCYVNLALITDYDVGLEGDPSITPVTGQEVMKVFAENTLKLKDLILNIIPNVPSERGCHCREALKNASPEI